MKLGQDGKLFVFILFIPESTHIIVWNAKRAEIFFNSKGNTVVEEVTQNSFKNKDKFNTQKNIQL